MESKQESWPLLSFKEYEKDINPTPNYQRGSVWKQEQRTLLIDSVLRKIDVPKIYLRRTSGSYKYEIIDGQQRMRTFWDFLNDKFPLEDEAEDIVMDGMSYGLAGRTYSELDHELRVERIYKYTLNVVILSEATEDEIADLFYRLNNGTPLSSSEVRNAMPGEVTKLVRDLARHPFFPNCAFGNTRMAYDQVGAQMLSLELYGGVHEVSDKVLSRMYYDYRKGIPERVKEMTRKNLDLLSRIFPNRSRLLNRAAAVNAYLLVSYLSKHSRLDRAVQEIREWFEDSEPARRRDNEYKLFSTRAANSRASIEGRFRMLLLDFLKSHEKFRIVELDERRNFSDDQKIQIYRKFQAKCQACGKKVPEFKWHADHKKAWVEGGQTEIENGQVLCVRCNLKKGAKLWQSA